MSTATKTRQGSSQAAKPRRTMPPMSPLSRGAHELAERSFRVFPLKPRSKKPAIKEWQRKATTSSSQIAGWWTKWPDANIAIATGRGLVVLDIDSEDALAYAHEAGLLDDETPTVKTGRPGDGIHRYFKDPNVGTRTHHLKDGDVKIEVRANGAYVVAPPSVHPDTGALYEWITDPDHPLALVPEWALQAPESPSQPIRDGDGVFAQGERHDRLHKLARAMRGIGMEGVEIESALRAANESRCAPVLTSEEIEEEIAGIVPSVVAKPAGWKPDTEITEVSVLTGSSTAAVVYAAIRHSCGYKDRCKVEQETLAEKIGKGRDTVIAAIKVLVEVGLIEVITHKTRWGTTACNEYVLLDRHPA